jgi:hypothetical protein
MKIYLWVVLFILVVSMWGQMSALVTRRLTREPWVVAFDVLINGAMFAWGLYVMMELT